MQVLIYSILICVIPRSIQNCKQTLRSMSDRLEQARVFCPMQKQQAEQRQQKYAGQTLILLH